ncbi:MAG: hypothetical protein RMJ53_08575 [Chitinophagales bacterium]|nr:hypothetical protein [Chitinophagales bacterium]
MITSKANHNKKSSSNDDEHVVRETGYQPDSCVREYITNIN